MRLIGMPNWYTCPCHGYYALTGKVKPDFSEAWINMKCQPSHKNFYCKECHDKWQKEHLKIKSKATKKIKVQKKL